MKSHTRLAAVATVLLSMNSMPLAVTPEPERPDPAQAAIQGTWKVIALEAEGQQAPESIVQVLKMTIKGRTLRFEPAEPGTPRFTYKLDPRMKPAGFDMIAHAGADAGQTSKGIYVLEGDTLKICLGSKERPKTFGTKPESGMAMYTFRRVQN